MTTLFDFIKPLTFEFVLKFFEYVAVVAITPTANPLQDGKKESHVSMLMFGSLLKDLWMGVNEN